MIERLSEWLQEKYRFEVRVIPLEGLYAVWDNHEGMWAEGSAAAYQHKRHAQQAADLLNGRAP